MNTDSQLAVIDSIEELRKNLELHPNKVDAEDFETHHRFAEGLYIRITVFPADTIAIGQIHKTDHLFVMLEGECLVASTEGLIMLKAPFVSEAKAGTQRVGFARTKCVFMNIHKTNTTDLHDLEKELVEPLKLLEV